VSAAFGVALADFRESVRRFSFVVIVALAVLLGYAVLSEVFVLRLGDHRGVYDAAWIGALMATTLGFFLSLAGFYLVRGGVQRDAATGGYGGLDVVNPVLMLVPETRGTIDAG